MSRIVGRSGVAVALLSSLTLVACGESAQEKAKAEVCDARASISKEVTALIQLELSTEIVTQAKGHVEAIGNELSKIKAAEPNLTQARKEQAEKATKAFEAELDTVKTELTSNLSLSNAATKLTSSLHQLANGYKQALEPIDCS